MITSLGVTYFCDLGFSRRITSLGVTYFCDLGFSRRITSLGVTYFCVPTLSKYVPTQSNAFCLCLYYITMARRCVPNK
jgi:hypothetical protein